MSNGCQCEHCIVPIDYPQGGKVLCHKCKRGVFQTCARNLDLPGQGLITVCAACTLKYFPETYHSMRWMYCCTVCSCGCGEFGINAQCIGCKRQLRIGCMGNGDYFDDPGFICYKCAVEKYGDQSENPWPLCCYRRECLLIFPRFRLFLDQE